MVEAQALAAPYQVRFRAGRNTGLADTLKDGVGGSAGLRPHELLEAALASCITISARMALEERGLADIRVTVSVILEREESVTRFRYDLVLDPPVDELHYKAVAERVERSAVRQTLSKPLVFEPV
ncbi:OsmC family protein [Nonomuraea sp. M3C6]|uniref:OsmC family protein n=1 Tax=Nonomuraea marmarensis TaxID=3351344 RepID=A0ABW7AW63_9ACTN